MLNGFLAGSQSHLLFSFGFAKNQQNKGRLHPPKVHFFAVAANHIFAVFCYVLAVLNCAKGDQKQLS